MLSSPARHLAIALAAVAAAVTVGVGSPVSARDAAGDGPARGTTVARTAVHTEPNATGGAVATPYSPGDDEGPGSGEVTQSLTDGMPGDRPNILFILTDDMRADELQFMPNVRRLIEHRGVNFVNSFSPYPLCCPARASLLSGKYTHNHGVWTNGAAYGFRAFHDRSTVATDLTAAGYQTAFLGKYLNGYGTEPPPDGSADDSYHYVPPGWQDWRGSVNQIFGLGTPEAGGTYSYFDTTLNVNGKLEGHPGEYQTRMFGNETDDMLQGLARSPRPFFLWLSFVAPHAGGPIEPDDPRSVVRSDGRRAEISSPARPRDVKGLFDKQIPRSLGAVPERDLSDKPSFMRSSPTLDRDEVWALTSVSRQRAESLYVVDQQVARIAKMLEEAGEFDNTIFVFSSDNGYFLGEHGMLETKRLPYESGLRVPTLMAGPGIPEGRKRHDPFLSIDFAPTFLDIAGARTRRVMDGVSMYDVARNGDRGWTRPVFAEAGPRHLSGGREPKLEIYPEGPSSLRFTQAVRTPRYLYVEHATGDKELYDLSTDPLELNSIVDEPGMAPVVRELAAVLGRLRMCQGAACTTPLPDDLQGPDAPPPPGF